MYKISPSILESFRVFKLEIYDTSVEDMINQIAGEFKPTPSMAFGTAVHQFLANPETVRVIQGNNPNIPQDFLYKEEVDQLKEIAKTIPQGINEIFHSITLNGVRYNMYIDRMVGNFIREIKTASSFYGIDGYEASVQWKIYALATGAKRVYYDVIIKSTNRPYKLKRIDPFYFEPYQGMQEEIEYLTQNFIDFCKFYNIEEHIKIKERFFQIGV